MDLKITYGLEENLSSLPIENGAIRATVDKENLYIDLADKRINFSKASKNAIVSKTEPDDENIDIWFELITGPTLLSDKTTLDFNKVRTGTFTISYKDGSAIDNTKISFIVPDYVTTSLGENGVITITIADSQTTDTTFEIKIKDNYENIININCNFIAPIVVTATTYTVFSLPEEDVRTNFKRTTNVGSYGNCFYWTQNGIPVKEKLNTAYLGTLNIISVRDIGLTDINTSQQAYFYTIRAMDDIKNSTDDGTKFRLAVDKVRQTNEWFISDTTTTSDGLVNITFNINQTLSLMHIGVNSPSTILEGGEIMLKTSSDLGTPTRTDSLQVFWNGVWQTVPGVSQNGKLVVLPSSEELSNKLKNISSNMAGKTILLKAKAWLKSSTYPSNYIVQTYNRFTVNN